MRSKTDGWHTRALGDIARIIRGVSYKGADLGGEGSLVGLGALAPGGGFKAEGVKQWLGRYRDDQLLDTGDIVISTTDLTQNGEVLGAAATIPSGLPAPAVVSHHLAKVEPISSDVDARYLAAALRSPAFRSWMAAHAGGTTVRQVKASEVEAYPAPVPPLDEQRRISRVLGALDDKIESNRRIAATLEEIAATLFKARFVDFVDHDDLVESEIGPVPSGWEVSPVGEAVKVVGGSTPSTKEPRYWEQGTHCWATPKDLSGLRSPVLLDTSRHITDAGVETISSGLLPERTVLLSSRAPVGYTAISMMPVAVNQGFIAIPPSDGLPAEYVMFWLRDNLAEIRAHAGGTTFAEISKRAFRPLPMLVPPADELDAFSRMARPIIDQIASLDRQRRHIASLRDTLLPRLISGQVRVSADAFEGAQTG